MPRYVVKFPLKHDAEVYRRGELIELDEAAAAKLPEGVLQLVVEKSPAKGMQEQEGK